MVQYLLSSRFWGLAVTFPVGMGSGWLPQPMTIRSPEPRSECQYPIKEAHVSRSSGANQRLYVYHRVNL